MKSQNTALRILLSIIIYFATVFVARMIIDSSNIPSALCACPSFLGTVDSSMTGCAYKLLANKYCLFGIETSPSYATYGPTLAWIELIFVYLVLPALIIFLLNKLLFKKKSS